MANVRYAPHFDVRPRPAAVRPGVAGGVAAPRRAAGDVRRHLPDGPSGRADRRRGRDRLLPADAHGDAARRAADGSLPGRQSRRARGRVRTLRAAQRRAGCASAASPTSSGPRPRRSWSEIVNSQLRTPNSQTQLPTSRLRSSRTANLQPQPGAATAACHVSHSSSRIARSLPPLTDYASLADAGRASEDGRQHRRLARVQAPVSPLPDRSGVRRRVPRRAHRRRDAGRRRAGRALAPSTSRSAILTSSTDRLMHGGLSSGCRAEWPQVTYDVTIKIEHLLRASRICCRAGGDRMPLRHQRRRVGRRSRARATGERAHACRLSNGPWRCAARRVWRWRRRSSPSPHGPLSRGISTCCRRSPGSG